MSIDRTPVLVGGGKVTNRDGDLVDRITLAAEATRLALADAGGGLAPDTIAMPGVLAPRTEHSARSLDAALGLGARRHLSSTIGGNTPQWLIGVLGADILEGRCDVALIAEARASARRARKQGVPPKAAADPDGEDTEIGDQRLGASPAEVAAGLAAPPFLYPILESAVAHQAGRTLDEQRRFLGAFMAPATAVAARHPDLSWFPNAATPEELTTPTRLRYTRVELLTDPHHARRIERNGVLLHGGYSSDHTYLPPRSVHRVPTIDAWTAQLAAAGHPTRAIEADAVQRAFVPNTDQAKMLLRNGATGAMTRILTLIGVVEGFGSDGIKLIPPMDLTQFIVEPTEDPPYHTDIRRLLPPVFLPAVVAAYEPITKAMADELIDGFLDDAQHVPIKVITRMLGIPGSDHAKFRDCIHRLIEESPLAGDGVLDAIFEIGGYLAGHLEDHRTAPRDDIITRLLDARMPDGRPLTDQEILGVCIQLLLAGIDTTWSAIGASLLHLATHPDNRQRLIDDPTLIHTATEEFLRVFAPVTMAREVVEDTEIGRCPMRTGDRLLLPSPAANRDPEVFDRPDDVVLDREVNRHFAFGVGIHRCLGSNLARMELRVAVQSWLERIPDFTLTDLNAVTWSAGPVRGPRSLRFAFTARQAKP
ncbi:cytochrome P450 [Actinomarinicola tropica]|uniref:Cytochrome P450 n=1 Tax=Actinomarinicola tropica TaxID=2789776 RepID=A0A5Q2RED3_9ACTN|nr:cytochrome P450 [Actinomarinicola tropica]QGG93993.1 cytochrome P450 [Actinomarinicola tropica]